MPIQSTLPGVTVRDRVISRLYENRAMSAQEIGEIFRIKPGTVRWIAWYVRRKRQRDA